MFKRTNTTRMMSVATAAALGMVAGQAATLAQCEGTKLTASDAASYDGLAACVAMDNAGSGPILVLGEPGDDNVNGQSAGAVCIFTRSAGVWGQTAKFFPSDLHADYNFGGAVGYDDPYLIVGAPGTDFAAYTDSGAFYMYERSGATWIPRGRYVPQFAANFTNIGWSVDVTVSNGGRAIIGAPTMDWDGNSSVAGDQNPESGAAYLYERLADGTWGYVTAFTDYDQAGTGAYQHLGDAVAIAGDVAVIGAPNGHALGNPGLSGYVKIIKRSPGGSWSVTGPSRLAAPDPQNTALFGAALDTDGTYVAVSAINQDSTAAQTPGVGAVLTAGCVYVYKWNAGTSQFDLDGQLFADDARSGMKLGGHVRISNGKVFASSYPAHTVYCFKREGPNKWTQEYAIRDPEPGPSTSFAGDFAAASDAVVVSDHADTRNALISAGAAFAFTINGSADAGNDSCDGATVVGLGNHSGCTSGATYGVGSTCGSTGSNGPGPDVWFSWTPMCSGNIIIDTYGSNYDTVLSVHTDCPEAGDAHSMACSDDAGGTLGLTSLVTFDFSAGTTYLIRVGGYNGAAGDYVLRINDYVPQVGDSCAAAVNVGAGAHAFTNCKSINQSLSGSPCTSVEPSNDVWFRYVPPVNGMMTADTCGSSFDTILQAFNGASCPISNAQALACSDDASVACAGNPYTSKVTIPVTAGQGYYLRVGGYTPSVRGSVGDGVLNIALAPTCKCDWNLNGALSVQDIFDYLAAYFSGNGDFNSSGATSVQDIFDFLACYFAGCA